MNTYSEENYLKAIYKLEEQFQKDINTNLIAAEMGTKAASVTDMLKKLSDKSLINYQKYKGVSLTTKGKKIALGIIRKHRLWEFFLVDQLKFKWDEVHEIAEELEHINSEKLIDALDEFLGFPQYDPHGDPIPSKKGDFKGKTMKPLETIEIGIPCIVSGVKEHNSVFLNFLEKIQINLGVQIQIEERNDFDGSLLVKIENSSTYISKDVAKNILVFSSQNQSKS